MVTAANLLFRASLLYRYAGEEGGGGGGGDEYLHEGQASVVQNDID